MERRTTRARRRRQSPAPTRHRLSADARAATRRAATPHCPDTIRSCTPPAGGPATRPRSRSQLQQLKPDDFVDERGAAAAREQEKKQQKISRVRGRQKPCHAALVDWASGLRLHTCWLGRRRRLNCVDRDVRLGDPSAAAIGRAARTATFDGMWFRTDASAANTIVSVPAISANICDGPDSSAHAPAYDEPMPPTRPTATAVPTPVARIAAG